jgi:Ca2+-binding EF-hand superfamily protein
MTQYCSVVSILLFAALAAPQEPSRQGGPGGPPPPGIALYGAMNTGGGESLTAAEIDAAPEVLRKLDANGDGRVTRDELPRPAPGGRGPGGRGRGGSGVGDQPPAAPPTPDEIAAMLMAFDKNGDGTVTKAELPERLHGLFARADDDRNGVLTADEIKKAAAAQPQPTAGGRGERGREGEGRGGPPRRDALFAALDRDGDESLSAEEIAKAPASLRTLDVNGDGEVTIDEVIGGGRGRGQG